MITVGVLLYGPHRDLADRCLGTILATLDARVVVDVRIGLNAVTPEVEAVAHSFCRSCPVPAIIYHPEGNRNVHKYPLMRRMFYDPKHLLAADTWMWFDDDSYITGGKEWWETVSNEWIAVRKTDQAVVMGSVYRPRYKWTEAEKQAIKSQPWFTTKALFAFKDPPTFATGGWWLADVEFMSQWNYPFPELRHNGGDVILGELCRQQRRLIYPFKRGIAINADALGRESQAKRRGDTTLRPFQYPLSHTYDHQKFDVVISSYPPVGA